MLAADVSFVDEQFGDNANTVVIDGYTLMSLRFGYDVDLGGRLALSPFVGINNLADETYTSNVRLNAAFRDRFGENIAIDLSYRSYADQVRARELFGGLAAEPGTSNHGWGTAIDTWEWQAYDFGSARHEWLVANGPADGWYCPAATESGNPEYWHFEYRG